MPKSDYCFLDLETTGLSSERDSILEISFIREVDGKEVCRFDEVVVPEKSPVTPFVTNLTGITVDEVEKCGKRLADVAKTVREKIGDSVIVGHNIDFDIEFLCANGVDISANERIDTHELARILLPGEQSFALEVLSEKYGFVHKEAHRAMSDVEASMDLFWFLLEKIEELPAEFLERVRGFLKGAGIGWFARELFLRTTKGLSPKDLNQHDKTTQIPFGKGTARVLSASDNTLPKLDSELVERLKEVAPGEPVFGKIGDSADSANMVRTMAGVVEKAVIVSPKLAFFSGVSQFPTPDVIFDPERLKGFAETRGQCGNLESTFYLKCAYRHFLGFRGLEKFDLFFKERDFWKEVCLQDSEHPVFVDICKGREKEDVLLISPNAFLKFRDLPLFKDRIVILDEAELFAETLLHFPTKTFSLCDVLNSKDEAIANASLFFVRNFCRDVMEKKLGHSLVPFPTRLLLEKGDVPAEFVAQLREIDDSLADAADLLGAQNEHIRWVNYFPSSGDLAFCEWRRKDFEELKKSIAELPKIVLHRLPLEQTRALFSEFLGVDVDDKVSEQVCPSDAVLEVFGESPSANNPGYNSFCGEKIAEMAQELLSPGTGMVVNFSSQEALRSLHEQVAEILPGSEFVVLGEGVSGGRGKLFSTLEKSRDKKILLFTQKLVDPILDSFNWKCVVVQKFPFSPPNPLFEMIDRGMKIERKSFWDLWIVPQVAANLARRISCFSSAKKVVVLDPRANALWGKKILRLVFGE